MKSYLSVDLDYWGMFETNTAERFIDKIISLNKPIRVYSTHEKILNDLQNYRVEHIYQVDYHSDICEDDYDELDEGTWANFYFNKKKCTFEWRYPSTQKCFIDRWGRCDLSQYDNRPWPRSKMGYKKVIRKEGLHYIKWDTIQAVGFSISQSWYDHELDFLFEKYRFLNEMLDI